MTDETPPLGETWLDKGTALAKGTIGMVPIAGSILGEIVGLIIPNQRLQRLETYARYINERLDKIDQHNLRDKLVRPESINLFEDGAYQAARSLSDDRKKYIADIVASGMAGDINEQLQSKRLLQIMNNIDDDQIIILAGHLLKNMHDQDFFQIHQEVLEPKVAYIGSGNDEVDAATLYREARVHLTRLGLLRPNFKKPRHGELPDFDEKTGMMKANGFELTSLGRLLLKKIGVANDDDF
jgi:hypothetical protein